AGFLETLHRDYKEIFLGNLERKKVVEPKIKLQPEDQEDQSGEEKDQKDQSVDQAEERVVQQDQAQAKAAKAKAAKKPTTKPEVIQS
ncbi:hypothetical protein BDCR2A_01405, partial [Borrelia duttonii CR2A]